jgi:hypothetical protein
VVAGCDGDRRSRRRRSGALLAPLIVAAMLVAVPGGTSPASPFSETLELLGITFEVSSPNDGSLSRGLWRLHGERQPPPPAK